MNGGGAGQGPCGELEPCSSLIFFLLSLSRIMNESHCLLVTSNPVKADLALQQIIIIIVVVVTVVIIIVIIIIIIIIIL